MNNDFLNRWEPEVIEPKESDWTTAGMSRLCETCKNLDEDGVCAVRGFQMDMAPPVYACREWEAKASMCQGKVEIMRTFTVEVTQILRVGANEAKTAEICMRGQDEKELERTAAASLGAENVKVRDLKVWVLDR